MSDLKKYDELLNTSIRELDFSVRVYNCLYRKGISTIGELIMMTEEEVANVKNIGVHGKCEIIENLKIRGLRLRKEGESVQDIIQEYINKQDGKELLPYIEILNTGIEELDLSVRSYNCLTRRGIKTIRSLISMTDKEIANVQNMGLHGKDEIIEKLAKKGLRLRRKGENILDILEEYTHKHEDKKLLPHAEILNVEIEELDLSVRTYNCLYRKGISTIGELIMMTEEELSRVRNLGIKGKKEVIDKLGEKGLRLRRDGETKSEKQDTVPFYEKSIKELYLSKRAYNCLIRRGIDTIKDLINLTDIGLSRIRNLGKTSQEEIIGELRAKGLRLRRESESVEDVIKEYESRQSYSEKVEIFADSVKGIDKTITNYLNVLNNIINKSELPNEIKKYWNRFYSSLKLPDTITIMGSEPEIESLNLAVLNRIDSCVNQLEIPDYIKSYWDEFYSELANTLENVASSEIAKLKQGKGQGK